ncbi:MAG: AtpZ/AtpI family protein [Candidatus Riflebacteria bacterium]|nr:AtpZ/AtpI family protein [Candidatus Riflebacteria bacterium]
MKQHAEGLIKKTGSLGNVLSTGFTGGVCLALSLFIGYKVDQYFLCDPWGIIGGIILGIAAAFVQTWKQLRESMGVFARENERDKKQTTQL